MHYLTLSVCLSYITSFYINKLLVLHFKAACDTALIIDSGAVHTTPEKNWKTQLYFYSYAYRPTIVFVLKTLFTPEDLKNYGFAF